MQGNPVTHLHRARVLACVDILLVHGTRIEVCVFGKCLLMVLTSQKLLEKIYVMEEVLTRIRILIPFVSVEPLKRIGAGNELRSVRIGDKSADHLFMGI